MARAARPGRGALQPGHLYQRAGRNEEAIACYRAALARRTPFAAAHNNLANALKVTGRRDEAIAHYTEAVRADPQLADALSNSARCCARRGASWTRSRCWSAPRS